LRALLPDLLPALLIAFQTASAGASPARQTDTAQLRLGNETLVAGGFKPIRGCRIGLLTNPSGVDRGLNRTLDLLRSAPGVKLAALFAAEHGLLGSVPAGTEFPDAIEPRTGLPIFSLYGPGAVRKPTAKMLAGLDALVYDIQDTGCRSYTYITTMGLAMDACAQAGVEFVVLDRPNPLGGLRVEGPLLDPQFKSHVGAWPIPYVYGMTCGELARMIQGESWISKRGKLTVVPMKGWRRSMTWRATGLRWVPTSPNIPHGDSPLFYVSTGILGQLGGVSIGIGSTVPFQCVAAPWLDGPALARALGAFGLPGVRFRPTAFQPSRGAFEGKLCHGVELQFTEPARAPLMALNLYALEAIRRVAGRDLFAEATTGGRGFAMFDKVTGSDATRRQLAAGRSAADIVRSWRPGEDAFRLRRQRYLLY
jgi:uncharacterized protein YbbC (DUF1343 family)